MTGSRAIRTLVAAIEKDSLDRLIGLQPEIWEMRDRDVSPDLIKKLEKAILERILGHLSESTALCLTNLSVYRKDFEKEAIERLVLGGKQDFERQRDELIDYLLLEQSRGWFKVNTVAREICLQSLKANECNLKKAHSIAATYFTRHFTGKRIVGWGKLGGYLVEGKYHLCLAGEESQFCLIAMNFSDYIHSTVTAVTPIPRSQDELNERIAVLSTLLAQPGAKGLEYHLARLLQFRGGGRDLHNALNHARRAIGRKAPAAAWILLVDLEEKVHGVNLAIEVCQGAIKEVSIDQASILYEKCANLLCNSTRNKEAVDILKIGIKEIPVDKNVVSLYDKCSQILVDIGRNEEAIDLLRTGIKRVPVDKNVFSLYDRCSKILSDAGRNDEAIDLLKIGVKKIPVDKNVFSLYDRCSQILVDAGRNQEAVSFLKVGIKEIPVGKGVVSLYDRCSQILVDNGRNEEAIDLLEVGIKRVPVDKNVFSLYDRCSKILSDVGRNDEAINLLRTGIKEIPVDKNVALLYDRCSQMLFNAGQNEEAIDLLKTGIKKIPATQNQYKLIENCLYTYFAIQDVQGISDFLDDRQVIQVNIPQYALGKLFIAQLNQEWQNAALLARQYRCMFPTYLRLATSESFSWLCVGDYESADLALNSFPKPIKVEKLSPISWLRSFICLRLGKNTDAAHYLSAYLGADFNSEDILHEDYLLHLWDTSFDVHSSTPVAFSFPMLPVSLTGFYRPIIRLSSSPSDLTKFIKQRDLKSGDLFPNSDHQPIEFLNSLIPPMSSQPGNDETENLKMKPIHAPHDASQDFSMETDLVSDVNRPNWPSAMEKIKELPLIVQLGLGIGLAAIFIAYPLILKNLNVTSTDISSNPTVSSSPPNNFITKTITIYVKDEKGMALGGAKVEIEATDGSKPYWTETEGGDVQVEVPSSGMTKIILSKDGYITTDDKINPLAVRNEYRLKALKK